MPVATAGTVAVLDIDSTIMDTRRRNYRILREAGDVYPELGRIADKTSPGDMGWDLTETLTRNGLADPELHARLTEFWHARFFTDEYVLEDEPYPGAAAFLRALNYRGIRLVYLTGRDWPNMSLGTIESFRRHGIPIGDGTHFLFKPEATQPDLEFKAHALASIEGIGTVALLIENEPANANLMVRQFPEALVLLIRTITAPDPETPDPGIVLFDRYPIETARPEFHFTPDRGWMNDPNGPFWVGKRLHLFFQLKHPVPDGDGSVRWGHITSEDLLKWETMPEALVPHRAAGETQCFSGCAIPEGAAGKLRLMYTSVPTPGPGGGFRQVYAYPADDRYERWVQAPSCDVLLGEPPESGAALPDWWDREWRDPYCFQQKGRWFCLIATAIRSRNTVAIALFEAADPNLSRWNFVGTVRETAREKLHYYECPGILKYGPGLYLLVWSPYGPVRYAAGEFHAATAELQEMYGGFVDWGTCFYATQMIHDPEGRAVIFGWIRGPGGDGWGGALALPRIVVPAEAEDVDGPVGEPRFLPHPALEECHAVPRSAEHWARDLTLRWSADADGRVKKTCFISAPEADPHTGWWSETGGWISNAAAFSIERDDAGLFLLAGDARIPWDGENSVTLRVFVDGPIVEFFEQQGRFVCTIVHVASPGFPAVCDRPDDAGSLHVDVH